MKVNTRRCTIVIHVDAKDEKAMDLKLDDRLQDLEGEDPQPLNVDMRWDDSEFDTEELNAPDA